jgi:glyoxylase-like metal-dependent hydrolase (beta-lactamase superfamily II)
MTWFPISTDIFRWTDPRCHAYVIRGSQGHAIAIDLGDGSLLDHLSEIGIATLDWVLLTHHHREQCRGLYRLNSSTHVAISNTEKDLIEFPERFRAWRPTLGDKYTVHGASYVRPPVRGHKVDKTFGKLDRWNWQELEFWCCETPGSSPGAMSYFVRMDDKSYLFSGDAMLAGGKLHNWFDTEFDYGFAAGIFAAANSAAYLAGLDADLLLPSHGEVVAKPREPLLDFAALAMIWFEVGMCIVSPAVTKTMYRGRLVLRIYGKSLPICSSSAAMTHGRTLAS